jgi:hypothetical protein
MLGETNTFVIGACVFALLAATVCLVASVVVDKLSARVTAAVLGLLFVWLFWAIVQ